VELWVSALAFLPPRSSFRGNAASVRTVGWRFKLQAGAQVMVLLQPVELRANNNFRRTYRNMIVMDGSNAWLKRTRNVFKGTSCGTSTRAEFKNCR
jgi:hypothetical protein